MHHAYFGHVAAFRKPHLASHVEDCPCLRPSEFHLGSPPPIYLDLKSMLACTLTLSIPACCRGPLRVSFPCALLCASSAPAFRGVSCRTPPKCTFRDAPASRLVRLLVGVSSPGTPPAPSTPQTTMCRLPSTSASRDSARRRPILHLADRHLMLPTNSVRRTDTS